MQKCVAMRQVQPSGDNGCVGSGTLRGEGVNVVLEQKRGGIYAADPIIVNKRSSYSEWIEVAEISYVKVLWIQVHLQASHAGVKLAIGYAMVDVVGIEIEGAPVYSLGLGRGQGGFT